MTTGDAKAGEARAAIDSPDAGSGSRPDAWDPHQVWLTRIWRPRDQSTRHTSPAARGGDTDMHGAEPGSQPTV